MKRTGFSPHSDIYVQYLKNSQKHNMPVQHYHDTYEIYLQLSGKRYLYYDDICYRLDEGSLAIFEPFNIHYAESGEVDYYERYVINFNLEQLKDILSTEEIQLMNSKIKAGVFQLNKEQTKMLYEKFQYVEYYQKQTGFLSQKLLHTSILQLIMPVLKFIEVDSITQGEKAPYQVIEAIKYVNKHYSENISLDVVTEEIHVSKYYFCRLFTNATGATFLKYLNNFRLAKVHSLLMETNDTIEKIAKQTGFSSSANLTRVFKNVYGVSPRNFRKVKSNNK